MREIRVIGATKTAQVKKRVAAYCRVSSDSADQLASYQAQVNRYTALISANHEWELAGIYADDADIVRLTRETLTIRGFTGLVLFLSHA